MGCLRTCGFLAAAIALFAGVYVSELARFRSNAPGARWVNWIGEFDCGPGITIERPQTLKELQDAVRRHHSVRAAATGHSFNPMHCPAFPQGAVIDVTALRSIKLERHGDGHKVVAEAGIKMGQVQNFVLAKGLTLRVPPGNSAYTVGGCIATGCHNLGQSHAQDLLAVTIVQHNGTLVEVKRGDPDFDAAAVSLGRLGVLVSISLEVLPYRSLQWSSERLPLPGSRAVIDQLHEMKKMQTSQETTGNKLVFYLATGVMMMEYWTATGRAAKLEEATEPLPPYINSQVFRVGQGPLTRIYAELRSAVFGVTPLPVMSALQVPAEMAFRSLHSSPALAFVRKALGWQHSPEARGEASVRPTGNKYTWAGWLDEVMNLIMGLRHIEVIFPLEDRDRAAKCLDIVFAHKHLAWWRLNVRTQASEGFYLSSTHADTKGGEKLFFARVDFVAPGALLDIPSGEASLTKQLHEQCPGWRKHWGKGLFATSSDEQWGEPEAFLEVANRWDPNGKFVPQSMPRWLSR